MALSPLACDRTHVLEPGVLTGSEASQAERPCIWNFPQAAPISTPPTVVLLIQKVWKLGHPAPGGMTRQNLRGTVWKILETAFHECEI